MSTLKCISLWQPWASAMAFGLKKVETRGWSTNVRGRVGIHAAKRYQKDVLINEDERKLFEKDIPLGAIVAVGELTSVVSTSVAREWFSLTTGELSEMQWGDYSYGRFAWRFINVRRLIRPIACAGRQGFFNVEVTDKQLESVEEIAA